MDPDQPVDRSVEYLDKIAPARAKSPLPPKPIIIGGIVAVVIALLLMIMSSFNAKPDVSTKLTAVYTRLQTLQAIASNTDASLKDSTLRATNASLSITLTGSISDLDNYLKSTTKKFQVPKTLMASEKTTLDSISGKLEDARLNVELDSTYAREMSYQISVAENMILSIGRQTKNKAVLDILQNILDNLTPIQKSFDGFTGSKE